MSPRIIVADDHPLFREAMVSTVRRLVPDALITQAGNLPEVLELIARDGPPDTLMLDFCFPGLGGVVHLAQLRRQIQRSTLIVVSMIDDRQLIGTIMAAGVDGFIGKSVSPEEIGTAILAIRAGEIVVKYACSAQLPQTSADGQVQQLTVRQQDVLRLIAQGKTNKEIARALDISPFTVRIHVSSLLKTLNVSTRTAAAVKYSGH